MDIHITAQGIITTGALITALTIIIGLLKKVVKFIGKLDKVGADVEKNREEREMELAEIRKTHDEDIKALKDEQSVIVFGLLACLKGLQEQGCNGAVTKAITKLEDHLNKEAHK